MFYHVGFCTLHSLIYLWDSEGRGRLRKGHKTVSQSKQPVRKCLANDSAKHRKIEKGEENTFPWKIYFLVGKALKFRAPYIASLSLSNKLFCSGF